MGAPLFEGIRVAVDPEAQEVFPDIVLARCRLDPAKANEPKPGDRYVNHMLFDQLGEVGWGKNSGFQALNLIAQLGVKRVLLIGIDATTKHGVHWHGRHHRLKNPTEEDTVVWRKLFDEAAPVLAARGIEVYNGSQVSELKAYRKIDLREFL